MNKNAAVLNESGATPMKKRMLEYAENFVTNFKPIPLNDGGTGSLKTALNRSARYNKPETRVTAPTSASAKP